MPFPRTTESVSGTEVCITRQPGKPLILLVRMASRDMGAWDTVWDDLCEFFSVAQFDLEMPSVAALEAPAVVFGTLSDACAAVASGLGYEDFHLLGWTGGTHVALRCAADFPARVRSCTLLNPFYRLGDMRAVDKGVEFMRVMMESGGRELYAYYWLMAGFSPGFVEKNFNAVERMVAARLRGDRFMQLDTARALQWIRALRGFWLTDARLQSIRTPTLIVGAGLDAGHFGPTAAMSSALHDRIPASTLRIAPDYGTLMLLEAPQEFWRLARPFYADMAEQAGR